MSSNDPTYIPIPILVLTVREVCRILRISRTKLWQLVKQKKLKKLTFGGRRALFSYEEVQRFIRENQR